MIISVVCTSHLCSHYKTDKIYRLKQSIRMREYAENKHLYLDAVYRLLSNADKIPVSYCNEKNLTLKDKMIKALLHKLTNNSIISTFSILWSGNRICNCHIQLYTMQVVILQNTRD